jgi:hypothetical protein
MKRAIAIAVLSWLSCLGCSSSSDAQAGGTCASEECGGPPPVHCANGADATLTCLRTSNGTCGWSIDCPPQDAAGDATDATDATDAVAD